MVVISDEEAKLETLLQNNSLSEAEIEVIKTLHSSTESYKYSSIKEFKFELTLRNSIVKSAKELGESKLEFKVFKEAYCNSNYWKLTNAGGFALKKGVKSSSAIKDIYINSNKYGTECATAIVIVYFKSLVSVLHEKLFLKLFPEIYLYSWEHLDPDLGIREFDNPQDYLPGDCFYFDNPDHLSENSEYQGENAIYLGKGLFYGHGIGINTGKEIIKELNSLRNPGSYTSAYLMKTVKRPNFKYLAYRHFNNR